MPISVLYYGGHHYGGVLTLSEIKASTLLPESIGSFYNWQYTLCFVSCIKSRIMFVRGKQLKKGGEKKAASVHIGEGHTVNT